jgi:hypothetical protein
LRYDFNSWINCGILVLPKRSKNGKERARRKLRERGRGSGRRLESAVRRTKTPLREKKMTRMTRKRKRRIRMENCSILWSRKENEVV